MSDKPLEFKDAMKIAKKQLKLLKGLSVQESAAVICMIIRVVEKEMEIPFSEIMISSIRHAQTLFKNDAQSNKEN